MWVCELTISANVLARYFAWNFVLNARAMAEIIERTRVTTQFSMVHAIFGIIIDEDYSKWFHRFFFSLPRIRHNFGMSSMPYKDGMNTWSHIHTQRETERETILRAFICVKRMFAYNIKLYCFLINSVVLFSIRNRHRNQI